MLNKEELKRFEERIEVDEETGCWNWVGYKGRDGYGRISLSRVGKSPQKTHRISYMHYNGKIEEGNFICHKCDNPACVNPKHLFSGTAKDNFDDMVSKGRNKLFAEGVTQDYENNSHAKLTNSAVLELVDLLPTHNNKQIAKIYNVSHSNISNIRLGKSWSKVTGIVKDSVEKYTSIKK